MGIFRRRSCKIVKVSVALLGLWCVFSYLGFSRTNTDIVKFEHRKSENTTVLQIEKLNDTQLVRHGSFEVSQLVDIFRAKVANLKKKQIWSELPPHSLCTGKETKTLDMCNDTAACKHPLPAADSQENIRNILTPVPKLKEGALERIKGVFNIQERRKYAFVTAASADHFDESQEMIMTLDKYIFPYLSNYSFYYYDMGLNKSQVKLVWSLGFIDHEC